MARDKITAADVDTLRHMVRLREKFDAGLFARDAGQRGMRKRICEQRTPSQKQEGTDQP